MVSGQENQQTGQGKQLSPELFNVGSITQALWCPESESTHFADDGGDIIAADTAEECQALIQLVAEKRTKWFNLAGLSLNAKKSELIGFGFDPAPITIEGETIIPSKSITFLGLVIDSNLKWDLHVNNLCDKVRWQAGRIRSEGRHLSIKDRKTLLHAWILSRVHFNALAYMPSLNSSQIASLQTAVNAGIRAVYGLPRRSITSISELRQKLEIPSALWMTSATKFCLKPQSEIGINTRLNQHRVLKHEAGQEGTYYIQSLKDN